MFAKSIVVFCVVIFISWTEGNPNNEVFKEPDQAPMNPANGTDLPRQKRVNIVGVVVHQQNVFDENSGGGSRVSIRQENNVYHNTDDDGTIVGAVINQTNIHFQDTSAENDSKKSRTPPTATYSAKPEVQNVQQVPRRQEFQYRPAPTYPYKPYRAYSAPTFQIPMNPVNGPLNPYNGPSRQARVLQAPNNSAMNTNFEQLNHGLDNLKAEMNSVKKTLKKLMDSLDLDE